MSTAPAESKSLENPSPSALEANLKLAFENTVLVRNCVSEIRELRDYNESLTNQLYKAQSDLFVSEEAVRSRDRQNRALKEESLRLVREVRRLAMRQVVLDLVDRAFLASVDKDPEVAARLVKAWIREG